MIETIESNKIENAMENFKLAKNSGIPKFKKIDSWLEKEGQLYKHELKQERKNHIKLKRGTIIKVDFGVNPGSELCHTHFAIVLSKYDNIQNETIVVLPLTSKSGTGRLPLNNLIKDEILKNIKKKLTFEDNNDSEELFVILNEYKKYTNFSYAFISQITTISKSRLIYSKNKFDIINKARCSKEVLNKIDEAIIDSITGTKLIERPSEDKVLTEV